MNPILAFLLTWLVNAVALGLTAAIVPGVRIQSKAGAAWGALALGFVAFLVKPVLTFLSIPFLILTLGFFYIVVLSFCFWIAGKLAKDFEVDGALAAFGGAVVLGLVNWVMSFFVNTSAWM